MTAQSVTQKLDTPTATRQFTIDPSHSSAELAVKHLVIATVKGTMRIASGSVVYDPSDVRKTRIEATLDPATIQTGEEKRDAHLRSADFLDAAQFPTMTFVSTEVEGDENAFRVRGDLTIRGVTRPATLEVQKDGETKDPWGKQRAAVTASATIDRTQWGLVWNQVLETGGVMVGDKVKVTLHVTLVESG